ncbi:MULTISPECIES: hypothetical protein [Pseudomonas]|uniref:Uncharacterized protein n=1 Tax=Pseudomonas quercus TaxID=2722792 RepID=A0ABX0YNC7_9PSED|nr:MULTISPECIES: hypothetical protein [Pseudomonas]MBF7144967.1 hypothetical protein [Pseudomonas sp. LY10J]NJP03596.1 hypothetical protein [Pseudomonas quercus]
MLDKAARALIGQEPVVRGTHHQNGGAFEFSSAMPNAHHATYEHDGQNITKIIVHDREGVNRAEINAQSSSAQFYGSHISSMGGAHVPSAAIIQDAKLPLKVNLAGQNFHVGPLRKRIANDQYSNLIKALMADSKNLVSDSNHHGYRAVSYTANIDNRSQLITLEFDRERNLEVLQGLSSGVIRLPLLPH